MTVPDTRHVAERWSANADRYARWGDVAHGHPRYREAWVRALAALVGHPRQDGSAPRRVADVGTGTGELALLLAGMGHDVEGFDVAEGMLAKALAKQVPAGDHVRFSVGDAYSLPLPDCGVDVVVNRMVLWTLEDPAAALREWQRVLASGGRIVVIDGLHFPVGRSPLSRARRMRSDAFWALEGAVQRLRDRRRGDATAPGGVRLGGSGYRRDHVQPPGMSWRDTSDIVRSFEDAGLVPVRVDRLDDVHRAQRRTAPLRWRLAGLLPRFTAVTWEKP
jgi:ubiquinone/menaquinone biosynthesis C-methylase UbiE